MNRQTNFNFIEEKLSLLATCIEMRGGLNILDLHLHSEIFYLHFFNLLFGWDLQNLNAVEKNADGEKYALKVDTKIVKGSRLYEFTPFDLNNFSSGKKQGEISCFDIAYTLFADEENIPCMHFLLNDKKELMHGNQLLKIANLVNAKGIQFVASILKDKLPVELNKDEYVILKLSQDDKLFRIERGDRA